MQKKRVILSAGGTGGHLFPAQATAQSLKDCEVLFVAGGLGESRFFDRDRFSFEEIASATFSFSKPLQLLRGSGKIWKGMRQSERILKRFAPDVVVGFGSFYTLPLLLAAKKKGIPIILHEQNAVPGKVNRLFSPFAHTTAVTFPTPLKGHVQRVRFPLRPLSHEDPWSYFGLERGKPTLLVCGGSQGAARLNALFLGALPRLKGYQILHFTGKPIPDIAEHYRSTPHCVKVFEPNLPLAMKIADLAITRAGAATLAELTENETPALLVPFPYATDNHQEKNARFFAGGEVHLEHTLNSETLAEAILNFPLEEKKRALGEAKANCQLKHLSEVIKDLIYHADVTHT